MKRFLTIAALVLGLGGCTSESGTQTTLKKAGFTKITTHGYDFFACSDDDTFATKFKATNPSGERVAGTVCCGWMKSCTIRF